MVKTSCLHLSMAKRPNYKLQSSSTCNLNIYFNTKKDIANKSVCYLLANGTRTLKCHQPQISCFATQRF